MESWTTAGDVGHEAIAAKHGEESEFDVGRDEWKRHYLCEEYRRIETMHQVKVELDLLFRIDGCTTEVDYKFGAHK